MAGICIPIAFFVMYLTINHIWNDFIDYTITGVKTFSNKNSYLLLFHVDDLKIKISAMIVPEQIVIMLIIYIISFFNKKLEEKEWFKNISILLVYSIGILPVIIPIADQGHFMIWATCVLISFVYLVYTLVCKMLGECKIRKILHIFFNAFGILIFAFTIISSMYNIYVYFITPKETGYNHYKYIIVPEYMKNRIDTIGEFIEKKETEGKKVYILDCAAPIYKIPLEIYDKNYDMFNKGNFGSKGEEGIIQDIEQKENAIFLITMYDKNWQNPNEVTDYVVKNYKKIETVSIFETYEKIENKENIGGVDEEDIENSN